MNRDAELAGSDVLAGGGEMGALMRAFDWSATPLGPQSAWPQPLRTTVRLMLATRHPVFLFWGSEAICLYNDAYRMTMGPEMHPSALGRPARQVWDEIWPVVGPQIEQVMQGGAATWHEDQLIPITRHGKREDIWWTYSYSPIDDPAAPHGVGGVLVICNDVTREHVAREALRVAEERTRLALSTAASVGTWNWDVTADRVYADARFAQFYGVDPGRAAQGEPIALFLAAIHPADQARVSAAITSAVETGDEFVAEYRLLHAHEGETWVLTRGRRLPPDNDGHVRFPGVAIDVTDRKRAEQALRETEERFRLIADSAPVPMWVTRLDRQRGFVNRAYADFLGTSYEDALVFDWRERIHPEDAPRIFAEQIEKEAALRPFTLEARYRNAAGEWRWLRSESQPRWDGVGRHAGFIGVAYDVTIAKQAAADLLSLNVLLEARVQERTRERDRLWLNSEDLLVTGQYRGGELRVSPSWRLLLGQEPTTVPARQARDLMHADDIAAVGKAVLALQSSERPASFEVRMRGADGDWRWIAWTVSPDPGGERFTGVGRDVTASRARQAELEAAQDALRQSQKMEAVGQLTGGLAHDFNNLLTGITGSLEMLQVRVAQGRLTELDRYINAAQGAARRAAALTHRLLAFSRRQTLDPKPTNVNRLIAGMEELVRRTMGPAVAVEVVTAGGLWGTLVDPHQLENALLNLCINARDAMPDGGRVTIETGNKWLDEAAARDRDLLPGQYVTLCVSDTGVGMTPDIVARAFDPFFTTKPIGQGTGLGLSMIYGFARQSGGQVRIYSEPGQGSMVCLYLPRHRVDATELEPAEGAVPPGQGQGETVLVVDDEPTIRMLIAEVLVGLGYTAIEAADGPAALRVLQSDARIDLLITDVGLPGGMNGRQVADAARQARPALNVLFITGYAENAVLSHGHLDHGMHVLTKPFAIDALSTRIATLIGAA